MNITSTTGTASEIMIEQLVASGIKHVFYNSGSREALFFDALNNNPNINGVLALHEGIVASMAGAYTQVNNEPSVMVVHLGAGLAQSMGQLYNVWYAGLPVVVITFVGDTGSFTDRINLDLDSSFGPTSISGPLTKQTWTVIEPEGLPQAIDRAINVATTFPQGPVHIAVYDKMLGKEQVNAQIIHNTSEHLRAGHPSHSDVEQILSAIDKSKKPLLYVGDGVWKTGSGNLIAELAEYFGMAITCPEVDQRSISLKHPQHIGVYRQEGGYLETYPEEFNPDLILSIGARFQGNGNIEDMTHFGRAKKLYAVGSDITYLKNYPGMDCGVLADESRFLISMLEVAKCDFNSDKYKDRKSVVTEYAAATREFRRQLVFKDPVLGRIRPGLLVDAIDNSLEKIGGGYITTEQTAAPFDSVRSGDLRNNILLKAHGGSEGWGVGAAIGAKLAAGDSPVVGMVGDGSLYYADSGLWSSVHHNIPLLFVIPNNGAYGIVAGSFGKSGGTMTDTGNYEGVVLEGIDPVKLANAFGMEGERVDSEDILDERIDAALRVVQSEQRPYLLDVRLPIGLPDGGIPNVQFKMK